MVRLTPPMSSDVKIPGWAEREAAELWVSLGFVNDRFNHVPAIARALLAAEQRGLEKAAEVAAADDGKATGGFGNPDFGPNVARRIAAAIRSLGEKA